MIIKKAEKSDLSKILKLRKICFKSQAEIYNNHNIPPLTETSKEIQKSFSEGIILKAVVDSKIIGSVRGHIKDRKDKIKLKIFK